MLERLLVSVSRGTVLPDEVLIVDNSDGRLRLQDGILYAAGTPARVVRSGPNLGVAASWNLLLREGAWIITNDDVVLPPKTFEEMSGALEAGAPFVGMHWDLFGQRPEVAQRIGYYDEGFFPIYYEDSDYHRRLRLAGIKQTNPCSEPHRHEQWASGMGTPEIIDRNFKRFVRKWGGPPDRETFEIPWNGAEPS